VRCSRPDLLPGDAPPAVDLGRRGLHSAQQVGAARGLGDGDGEPQLAFGQVGQEALLLLLVAVEADRLRAGEGVDPPGPGQAGQGPGQFARQDHLGDDITAGPAVLLIDADRVEARLRHLVEKLERVVELVLLHLQRNALGALALDPIVHHLAELLLLVGEGEVHREILPCLLGRTGRRVRAD